MQPRGKGSLPAGSPVTALVIDPLPSAPVSQSFFSAAAGLDDYTAAQLRGEALKAAADQPSSGGSFWMLVYRRHLTAFMSSEPPKESKKKPFITPQEISVGLLTISDRVRT